MLYLDLLLGQSTDQITVNNNELLLFFVGVLVTWGAITLLAGGLSTGTSLGRGLRTLNRTVNHHLYFILYEIMLK
jgi:hypothetical protein